MLVSSFSPQFTSVFGASAGSSYINYPIPSTTSTSGVASLDQGFPSVTMTDPTAGGIPPLGQDFNGILKMLSTSAQNYEAGNVPVWSSSFATSIGGYPRYALVQYGGVYYTSLGDSNTGTPGVSSSWQNLFAAYITTANALLLAQEASGFWNPVTNTSTVTAPSWATRFEAFVTAGGGGGAGCQGSSTSQSINGAGGGGGGTAYVMFTVASGNSIGLTVGSAGSSGSGTATGGTGGSSIVTKSSATMVTATGGSPGAWYATVGCSGGQGGTATSSGNSAILAYFGSQGGYGSDGQWSGGSRDGNGGATYWGGGGRAGVNAGIVGQAWGSGGGGAYSLDGNTYSGGAGKQGFIIYRFLP